MIHLLLIEKGSFVSARGRFRNVQKDTDVALHTFSWRNRLPSGMTAGTAGEKATGKVRTTASSEASADSSPFEKDDCHKYRSDGKSGDHGKTEALAK